MKKAFLISVVTLLATGCSTFSNDYKLYLEQNAKLAAANNASEAACLLVLAEAVKTGDNNVKSTIGSHISKCRKEVPEIEPPKRNWLGF